jgi:hypothetical protein
VPGSHRSVNEGDSITVGKIGVEPYVEYHQVTLQSIINVLDDTINLIALNIKSFWWVQSRKPASELLGG